MYALNATEVTDDIMVMEDPRYFRNKSDAWSEMLTQIFYFYQPGDGEDSLTFKCCSAADGYDVIYGGENVGFLNDDKFETEHWEGGSKYLYKMKITKFEPEDIK